ncbi:TonB-dependent receptor [Mucilaginibacter sp.]|uniref:SusC/RagA family TonB-linked outer membrane protein n=1 Tax=Mucilaginibacter sp. TaxID=1882438 RepID=UPI00260AD40A|nr:TonB-dependent receptor [Mucilaginibacter sp.]MDB4926408.1 SusC/RagA family TonB-linked outer membrane protein [Mucilaginibacter sp.]
MEIFIHAKSLRIPILFFKITLLLLIPCISLAQTTNPAVVNSNLSGTITDVITKEPLVGAVVTIKGITNSSVTDVNGKFNIVTAQKFPYIIVITYIGYETTEVIASGTPLNVALKPTNNQLNDVVIVGYAVQEKKDLVGSISKIDAKETKDYPAASFDAQLQGKAAGVQINSNTGTSGEATFVRVRGTTSINASNSPLYIVDGVFVNNTSLQTMSMGSMTTSAIADINPDDIESIEVLKDATATAIYGSRGANGVIIVTTKRGSYNKRPTITFNTLHGLAAVDKSRMWHLVSGPENAALVNLAWINSGIDNPALNQTAANEPYRSIASGGRGTPEEQKTYDRLDDVFRTAVLSDYDLSVQGGNKDTKYYIAAGYTNQQATIKPVYFNRASLKFNIDQKLSNKVTIGLSNGLYRSYRNQLIAGSTPRGIFESALLTGTNLPTNNADGTPALWGGFDNVDVLINNNFINTVSLRYIGNFYLDAEILSGLKFHSSWGMDYNNYNENQYWNDQTVVGAAPTNGSATSSISQNTAWVNEQTLSYRKVLNKNTFGVLVGNTLQSNILSNTTATGTNFPNNSYTQISSAANRSATQSWTKGNLASFFSRIDYNYASKYYLELTGRADGSSRFGKNNQWGYFPSIGGSWRIKEENFLKNVDAINDLKLRVSYGTTGNQTGINDFAAQGLWTGGAGYPDNASSGDKPGTAPQQLSNLNLKWEKTTQTSVGLDGSFVDSRINIGIDLYRKYTTNVLLQLPVPAISGFTSIYSNAGEISNKGFELLINTINIRSGAFKWETSFNISTNINKIEKLPIPIDNGFLHLQQGYPMYSFLVYKQLYVDPQTGNAVYDDSQTKDGKTTAADKEIIGQALPKFIGGFSNNFKYHNFDASLFFSFQTGNKVYDQNRAYGENGGTRADRSYWTSQLTAWQKPGDITNLPRITTVGTNYTIDPTTRVLEDGSFLRLKTLSLGYTLPKPVASKLSLNSLRIYFTGSNLWLLTKYKGYDPESYFTLGNDFSTPPQPRSFQLGINLTL